MTLGEQIAELMWVLLRVERKVDQVTSAQQEFDADIAALTAFFTDLTTQLTNIQTELANRGVTDVTSLDALVTKAASLQPTVDSLGGTPAPSAGA